MVRTTKECKEFTFSRILSLAEFNRLLIRIESVINQRPIIEVDGRPISAFEVAFGRAISIPSLEGSQDVVRMFRERQQRLQDFERAWIVRYVSKLERFDSRKSADIKIGDLVLVPGIRLHRSNYPLARIIQPQVGPDRIWRSAIIKMEDDRHLMRPTNGLIALRRGEDEKVPVCY